MRSFRTSVAVIFLLSRSGISRAQDPATVQKDASAPPQVLAGHSAHGEAFNDGPRQKAYLMKSTGDVVFPVTTKSRLAQQFFNQGVGQLHGFWYFESERSFRQVAAIDPQCAMAFWGMAMSNIYNEKRAKLFIADAVKRKAKASQREQMWIDALAKFYQEDKRNDNQRKADYAKDLEAIMKAYPSDVEPKAFYALQLWENNGGMAKADREKVDKLLNEVLAVNPLHPCHHYRIHLWNFSDDSRALNSAALGGPSGPGIAHLWHMPGHTYSVLKRYADAAWQQEASARVDHAQMMRDRVIPDQIHNYAHNNQWLISDLIYVGRINDAISLAKNMIELPRHPQFNDPLGRGGSSSFGRDRLFDVLTTFELWDELIRMADTVYLEPTDIDAEQVKRMQWLGIAHFSKGEVEGGSAQIPGLEAILKKLHDKEKKATDEAEAEARKKNDPADKIKKAREDAVAWMQNDLKKCDESIKVLRAYESLASGRTIDAGRQFDEIKSIPADRMARIRLELGDKEQAEKLAREAAGNAKNQVEPLANLVDILERCGKQKEALEKFKELQPLCTNADISAPVFQRISKVARLVTDSSDWRPHPELPNDIGERPDLDKLGPFRWRPMPAAQWSLRDATGKRISLDQFKDKPVVVFFFLGHGCVHCMEQLNAFAPVGKDFAAAGISMVAVSTDTAEGLKKTFPNGIPSSENAAAQPEIQNPKSKIQNPIGGFPFPLLSDASLRVFKSYRCYDDFEKIPLHGTFFIDGNGLVRWQDINFEPFKDTKFLLDECKRLLKQDAPVVAKHSQRISSN